MRLDPANLDAKILATADLVCLDHPGKLSDDAIKVLSASLRRGRPVLYVAGETIDATNLKRLAEAGSTGLRMPVEFTPPPDLDPQMLERLSRLTEREREVFDLLVDGDPNKVVAYKLSISPRTVEIHRARVMEKLGLRNVAELVRVGLSLRARPRQGAAGKPS